MQPRLPGLRSRTDRPQISPPPAGRVRRTGHRRAGGRAAGTAAERARRRGQRRGTAGERRRGGDTCGRAAPAPPLRRDCGSSRLRRLPAWGPSRLGPCPRVQCPHRRRQRCRRRVPAPAAATLLVSGEAGGGGGARRPRGRCLGRGARAGVCGGEAAAAAGLVPPLRAPRGGYRNPSGRPRGRFLGWAGSASPRPPLPAAAGAFLVPSPRLPAAPSRAGLGELLAMAGYLSPGAYFYAEEQEYLQAYEDVLERYKGRAALAVAPARPLSCHAGCGDCGAGGRWGQVGEIGGPACLRGSVWGQGTWAACAMDINTVSPHQRVTGALACLKVAFSSAVRTPGFLSRCTLIFKASVYFYLFVYLFGFFGLGQRNSLVRVAPEFFL